jgi:sec-independent protein translocase protein TatA
MRSLQIVSMILMPYMILSFVPPQSPYSLDSWKVCKPGKLIPKAPYRKERKSIAHIQTSSLFGLGPGEIAIIMAASLLVLGPDKISEIVRSSGKIAGELKDELRDIPVEFQKGLEEGEINARASKAKKIEYGDDDGV